MSKDEYREAIETVHEEQAQEAREEQQARERSRGSNDLEGMGDITH